jgi:hypothetical protein
MVVRAAIAVLIAALALPVPAFAQRNKFDALRQCERYAAVQFKKRNEQFKRFIIDRASANENKYADRVGTQFVSTVYSGKALYEAGGAPVIVRFICLHAGYRKGPVFVYVMGD